MSLVNWQRWLFWLLLGAFSVVFAEVLSGSDPFVFFHYFGLLGVYTHYTLHVLVLAPLVIRPERQVRFGALFLAGAIFGLYEAYMTKVLWSPPWDADALRLGGVAVFSSAMLVLFWHPFFSFILPLLVADCLLLDSNRLQSSLPMRVQRWLRWPWMQIAAGMLAGVVHSAQMDHPLNAFLSAAGANGVILILLFLWDVGTGVQQFELAEILPRRKTWLVCFLLLLAYYLAFGFTIRPEFLPGWEAQAGIWGLYLLFGGALWLVLRQLPSEPIILTHQQNAPRQSRTAARRWLPFALVFSATSTISAWLLAWAGQLILLVVWVAGIVIGLFALGYTAWQIVGKKQKS